MPAERRWLFSQDQGSTYLLCRLTMYESSSLCYVTKHEVFVPFFFLFFFLSLWSTKISSKATGDVTSRLWRLKAQRFHIFRNICVIIVNTNTLKMHSYRRQRGCSFLFLRKVTFEQSPSLLLYDYLLFVLTKGWKTGTKVSLNKFTVL